MLILLLLGRLTQLVECLLDVEKVSGSSPLTSTKKQPFQVAFFVLTVSVQLRCPGFAPNRCALTLRFRKFYFLSSLFFEFRQRKNAEQSAFYNLIIKIFLIP